jgi:predicted transcriptional regulator
VHGTRDASNPTAGVVGYHELRDDRWHICYGDAMPSARDATVAHQLKLILDEPFGNRLYPPTEAMATAVRKSYVAEYFAMCLTLPGHWVEQAWHDGERDVEQLATLFGTSAEAMRFRLKTLRLV